MDTPAHIVEMIIPGGFEGYFPEMSAVLSAPRPDDARAEEIRGRYGVEMELGSIGDLHRRFGLDCPS